MEIKLNIGVIYYTQKKYKESIQSLEESWTVSKVIYKQNNNYYLPHLFLRIALSYFHKGLTKLHLSHNNNNNNNKNIPKSFLKSIDFAKKSIKLLKKFLNPKHLNFV